MTLDTGALIAATRNERGFWAWWKSLVEDEVVAAIPAPALAQAWRSGRDARLGQLAAHCCVLPMDEEAARRTGELCREARSSDVVDAFVVYCAALRGDDVLTSDPGDLRALADHAPSIGRIRALDELR